LIKQPEDDFTLKIQIAINELMKNMKEDLEDEDSQLSDKQYDYNLGRDALTFMKFLKDCDFY
jgi:hypothetical protein